MSYPPQVDDEKVMRWFFYFFAICGFFILIYFIGLVPVANAFNISKIDLDPVQYSVNIEGHTQIQNRSFENTGKYEYIPLHTEKNVKVTQHEFLRPDGNRGYALIYFVDRNDVTYMRKITRFFGEPEQDTGWFVFEEL